MFALRQEAVAEKQSLGKGSVCRVLTARRALLFLACVVVAVVGYVGYQLFVAPQVTRLPATGEVPFFSVDYLFTVAQDSPVGLRFGAETMSAGNLGGAMQQDMVDIKSAGFDGVKLHFYFRTNNYLQERLALKAAQAGLYPIGLLAGHNAKPRGRAFDEREMVEWEAFVRGEVKANRNYVHFWEIWNEPGLDLFRYGTAEEYVELLRRTSSAIRQEDAAAKIIVTLDAEAGGETEFSDQVLALGGGQCFDILSFHPYAANPYIREDLFRQAIAREKELVAKYGDRWPLMMSEIGQPASEVSEEEQARLGLMVCQEAIKEGIPLVWYYYSDRRLPEGAALGDGSGWGLVRSDGSPRPLFEEMKKAIQEYRRDKASSG